MEYIYLLYRSIPTFADFDDSDREILKTAVVNNAARGITGYLWRTGDQFFQALHGPMAEVDALYQKLIIDPRHQDVELLLRAFAPATSPFKNWSMGYDHFIDTELDLMPELDGSRPALSPERAVKVWDALVRAAESAMRFGSIQPIARAPQESERAYLERISDA
ncbi:BLUF domain-containing protein [Thioclava sp.]|uniref:BLUF domain-containing protein n=1 Tax=Thioclava sp. TaxID=1933450 RepID=UPI003AA7E6A3